MKSNRPQSEGVRELVFACSVTLCGLWTFIMCNLSLSHYLLTSDGSEFSIALFFTLIGGAALYYLPKGMCKFVYWIKDGFVQDKKRNDAA